jgi:hypothetical protein
VLTHRERRSTRWGQVAALPLTIKGTNTEGIYAHANIRCVPNIPETSCRGVSRSQGCAAVSVADPESPTRLCILRAHCAVSRLRTAVREVRRALAEAGDVDEVSEAKLVMITSYCKSADLLLCEITDRAYVPSSLD